MEHARARSLVVRRAIAWAAASAFVATALLFTSSAAPAVTPPDIACKNPGTDVSATPISIAGARIGVFSDTTQIFPEQLGAAFFADHGAAFARGCTGRNAFTAFQIAVTATAGDKEITSVAPTTLTGPGGATIPVSKIRVYRAGIVKLTTLSDASFATAQLPRNTAGACSRVGGCPMFDPLYPTVDHVTGVARTGVYPETVPSLKTRVIWVDVLAPEGQAPGHYSGSVNLNINGVNVPVPTGIDVTSATIPSFGTDEAKELGTDIQSEFRLGQAGGAVNWAKFPQYARLGLESRVSLWLDGSPGFFNGGADWASTSALLQGTDPATRLQGSRLTDVSTTRYTSGTDLTDLRTKLTSIGQAGKAWFWCDELNNTSNTLTTCTTELAEARQSWPTLPLFAIPKINGESAPDPLTRPSGAPGSLSNISNIRGLVVPTPYLDPMESKPGLNPYPKDAGANFGSRAPAFTTWRGQAPEREFWSYNSCLTEGCGVTYLGSLSYKGWTSYAIDKPGTSQPALAWQNFNYDIDGEHYYHVNRCPNQVGAALDTCLYASGNEGGSNGDGQLFYTSAQFGLPGANIPVESLRLKRIRDGRQAYALLAIAKHTSATLGSQALAISKGLFPEMGASEPSTDAYETARENLLQLMWDGTAQPTFSAPTGVTALAGTGSATVSWSPPANTPGTLTGYQVTATSGGAGCTSTGTLSCVVSGLTNGTSYAFTVVAKTATETSPASVASNIVTPSNDSTRASAPRNVVAYPQDGYAIVDWNAPTTLGAGSLVKYQVRNGDDQVVCESVSTQCDAINLVNGSSYAFKVAAMTSMGLGEFSPLSAPVVPNPYVTNTARPTISGTVRYGSTVTAQKGTWGNGATSFAYVWKRDGSAITGATGMTYKLTSADVGRKLTVMVRGSGPDRLDYYVTSLPSTVGKALIKFSESSANTTKRLTGVRQGGSITLTFTLGSLANGGRVKAVISGHTKGLATVQSGKIVITVSTSGISRGLRGMTLYYGGTFKAAPTSKGYYLRVR